MKFKVALEASDEGGYTILVPSLPGCISEGKTISEALSNIQDAIELYLEPVDDDWVSEESALVKEIEVLKITIPAHKPVKRSTLAHILKQARLNIETFLDLI